MMTPDRRAKMVELAEAFRRVNNAKALLDTANTDPYCQNSVIEMLEDGLDAAAERLDKAMVEWWQDYMARPVQQTTTIDQNGNRTIWYDKLD
jgi:hypothetical protein